MKKRNLLNCFSYKVENLKNSENNLEIGIDTLSKVFWRNI